MAIEAKYSARSLREWWKNDLGDLARGNIYLAALIVLVVSLNNAIDCGVRGKACFLVLNYQSSDAIPDFDSLPDMSEARRSDLSGKN